MTDARGRQLLARIELREGRLRLRIDDRGASYPLRIDPFVQQAKLIASDGANFNQLGLSVAVSGHTVVAGAPLATVNGNPQQGAAYVFVKPAGGLASEIEAAKLIASDGAARDELGDSVAVSGNTVVASAPEATATGNSQQGAAYVFVAPVTTSTDLAWSPGTVAVGQPTTCTATVTDSAASATTPTGTVSFTLDTSGGTFSNSDSCTLFPAATSAQPSCQVTYTPGEVGSGTHTITASYRADSTPLTSSGSTTATVTKRTTSTRVRCTTIRRLLRWCAATVTDTGTGTATTPTGTVTFTTTSRLDRFTSTSCTLVGSGAAARCSVTYNRRLATRTITATDNGDSTHAVSAGSAKVKGPRCRHRWPPDRRPANAPAQSAIRRCPASP